jgi:hypothetical protein
MINGNSTVEGTDRIASRPPARPRAPPPRHWAFTAGGQAKIPVGGKLFLGVSAADLGALNARFWH